jgi:oligoendopeptidase F
MTLTQAPYETRPWNLEDLFPAIDSVKVEVAFEQLEHAVEAFEKHREALTDDISPETLMAIVAEMEQNTRLAYRLFGFAHLSYAGNTQDQEAQTFIARMQQFITELQNRTLFFSLWWKELDAANAERLMEASGNVRYWLEEMRNFKPHTLSEAEEKIINLKDVTGSSALETLYSTITNRYTFKFEVDGEIQEMTRDQLMNYAFSSDPDERLRTYEAIFEVFGHDAPVLGQIYQALVRDWRNENITMRSFDSPMSVRNLANDLPDEVVDTLLDVSVENTPMFQRFFRLKAKVLGMEKLSRFDIYAPIAASEKTYEFDEAVRLVFDAFTKYDPVFAEKARQVLDADQLDSEMRKGKLTGAFCLDLHPKDVPWVLMNFKGIPRDVATLAHELGHAIHALLAADHSILTYTASLPLAETASTFGEMLLIDAMLEQEPDEAVRRELLFRQMDDAYATIMRQIFFALFEREAHKLVGEGASVDQLSEAYLKNLEAQFGDAVDVDERFRHEWVAIPHIYSTPFYVYAYAFGQLLVFSLYRQYQQEGEAFKPRLLRILAAGGSAPPVEVLKEAGIDISSPAFWQGGFDIIAEMLNELERLAEA